MIRERRDIEIIHTNGNRRFVKRIIQFGNKKADIDTGYI